jgi:hypothetical protein
MALPKDPLKPEFYVYCLCCGGAPFYVGIGRDKRASDRVRYVKYMLARQASGKPVKWNFSATVIADLIQRGCDVTVEYVMKGLTRAAALDGESAHIRVLLASGAMLANSQQNPTRPLSPAEVAMHAVAAGGLGAPNKSLERTREG